MTVISHDNDGGVIALESKIDLRHETVTGKQATEGQVLKIENGRVVWGSGLGTIIVRKNSGANIGTRGRLNFIEGSNITLDISDDSPGDEIDITINGSGGSPTDAAYLVLSSRAELTAERVLTAGTGITFNDTGANGTLTVNALHNLLSASHLDTAAESVVRGDLIVGNSTPAWSRIAIGANATYLRSNGTDPSWSAISYSDLPAAAQGWTDDGTVVRLTTVSDQVGIGTASPAAATKVHIINTTEQLRLGYDASNYTSFTTSSAGDLTIAPSGGDTNITGTLDVSGFAAFGNSASVTTSSIISAVHTYTDIATASFGVRAAATHNLTANNANQVLATRYTLTVNQGAFDYTTTGVAIQGIVVSTGASGTVTGLQGLNISVQNTGAGTLASGVGIAVQSPINSGGGIITGVAGISVANHTTGTNNSLLILGQSAVPSGNFSIYSPSTYDSYFAGRVGVGDTTPDGLLGVTGASETVPVIITGGTVTGQFGVQFSHTVNTNTASARPFHIAPAWTGSGAAPVGVSNVPSFAPTATITNIFGATFSPTLGTSSNDVTNFYGVQVQSVSNAGYTGVLGASLSVLIASPAWSGSSPSSQEGIRIANQGSAGVTSAAGLVISAQSGSTKNTHLLIGPVGIPSGTWAIYDASTADNYINGNVSIGGTTIAASLAKGLQIVASTAPGGNIADGVVLYENDRGGTAGKGSLHIRNEDGTTHVLGDRVGINQTSPTGILGILGTFSVASAAGAVLRDLWMEPATITITGSTNITTATGFNFVEIGTPTYSNATITIDHAATLYIANSPQASGGAVISDAYAIWSDSGVNRLDGKTTVGNRYSAIDSDASALSANLAFGVAHDLTVASAASLSIAKAYISADSLTLTGSTDITSPSGLAALFVEGWTIAAPDAGAALDIDVAATVRITQPQIVKGGPTIANIFGLWSGGKTRLDDSLIIGGTVPTGPSARIHVIAPASSEVARIETEAASGDSIREQLYQNKTTTTDATPTTMTPVVAIPSSTTIVIEAHVVARRTGGSAGTAEDGAGYVIRGTYKNVGGTETLIGAINTDYTAEDQTAWDATFVVSGGGVRVQVTGAANNNITWHAHIKFWRVGS